jgi:hypothetical protein
LTKNISSSLFADRSACLITGPENQVSADNQPLSEVLVQLRDGYGMAFSFDDAQLRRFLVTLDNEFQNTEAAMDFLLKDFPLSWEKTGEVYVIYSQIPEHPAKPANYLLRDAYCRAKNNGISSFCQYCN